MMKNILQFQIRLVRWRSTVEATTAAHSSSVSTTLSDDLEATDSLITAKPYSQVPGPTPWPIIGNTWRMLPVIGIYYNHSCI